MAASRKRRSWNGGHFLALPDAVINSPSFAQAGGNTIKALLVVGKQYTGRNNGALRAPYALLREYGFRSKGTASRALADAVDLGLLVITRHGGLHMGATLYALGWHPINDIPSARLEVAPTLKPASSLWKFSAPPP